MPLDVPSRRSAAVADEAEARKNLTCIFITHNLSVTEYLCDRIAVMYLGRIEVCRSEDSTPPPAPLHAGSAVGDPGRRSRRPLQPRRAPKAMSRSLVNLPSWLPVPSALSLPPDICKTVTPPLKRYSIDGRSDHLAACHLIDAPEAAPELKTVAA